MSLGLNSDITCLGSRENEYSMLCDDSPRQEFSKAIFENLKELYASDINLEVTIVLNDLQPNPQQWVGLFKVGWKDLHADALVRKQVDYDEQQNICRVNFEAACLPHDFGQYMYQLCYVSENGAMVGASTPFDIIDSTMVSMDDFVEHEEDDLLIIKQRHAAVPEELAQVRQEHSRILQKNQLLEKEQDVFVHENQKLNRQLGRATAEVETLSGTLREREHQVTHQQRSIDDLRGQTAALLTERDEWEGRYRELEQDNAALTGRIAQLERTQKGRAEDVARLQEAVSAKETSEEIIRRELESLKKSLFSTMEEKETNTAQHLSHINSLAERISTLERELALATEEIHIRDTQIEAFRMANEKIATDVETAVEQADRLKRTIAEKTRECVEMQDSVRTLEDRLVTADQRVDTLVAELHHSRQSAEKLSLERTGLEAAAAAREIVIKSLQERTSRAALTTSGVAKASDEVKELRSRLEQAREEYKKKAAQCHKLEMRLAKQTDRGTSSDDGCDAPDSDLSELEPDYWKRLYEKEKAKLDLLRQYYSERACGFDGEVDKERAKFKELLASTQQRDMRQQMEIQKATTRTDMFIGTRPLQTDEDRSASYSALTACSHGMSHGDSTEEGDATGHSETDKQASDSEDGKCFVCAVAFAPEMPEKERQDHIRNHFGPQCPVCLLQFKKHYPQEDFERHVYSHFNE